MNYENGSQSSFIVMNESLESGRWTFPSVDNDAGGGGGGEKIDDSHSQGKESKGKVCAFTRWVIIPKCQTMNHFFPSSSPLVLAAS